MMKKWIYIAGATGFFLFLIHTPDYWRIFRGDEMQYRADTFYYIIKEEYRQNESGQRLYQPVFTNLQNGDILVTDSTYCFCFRHGHAALVIDAEQGITLEAFGLGTESEYSRVSEWRRYPHVLVLRLSASEEEREEIIEYAMEELTGIPYMLSPGMIDDKDMDEEYWGTQCAHLIWAAFFSQGYDIDGDGGWLVTPEDFVKSELLKIVPQK